jgi:hypothetical protein
MRERPVNAMGKRSTKETSGQISQRMALYLEGTTRLSAMFSPSRRQLHESRHQVYRHGCAQGTYTAKDIEALCINMKIPRRPRQEGRNTIITSSDGSLEVRVEKPNAEGKVMVEAKQLAEGDIQASIEIVYRDAGDSTRLEYQTQNPLRRWLLNSWPKEVNIVRSRE